MGFKKKLESANFLAIAFKVAYHVHDNKIPDPGSESNRHLILGSLKIKIWLNNGLTGSIL